MRRDTSGERGGDSMNNGFVRFGATLLELDEVYSLAGSMGVSQVEAGGYIALVVALGIARADDNGIIDDLTTRAIEKACYWDGERGELLEHFLTCNVLAGERDNDTNPLRISPALWSTLAGAAVKQRKAARERKRNERARKNN